MDVSNSEHESIFVSDNEIAYMAGILDGEGSVCISKFILSHQRLFHSRYQLHTRFCNTNKALVDWAKTRFGFTTILETQGRKKPVYRCYLSSRKAYKLLILLLPHLIIKRKRAELGISFFENSRHNNRGRTVKLTAEELDTKENYYQQMRKL